MVSIYLWYAENVVSVWKAMNNLLDDKYVLKELSAT
jgi:hypothetical protein